MTDDIYVNAIGVEIRLDTDVSLSGATRLEYHVMRPDGVEVIWTATQYGSSTSLTYTTISGDFNVSGTYYIQTYVEWGATSHHWGLTYELEIHEKYEVIE